jgi:hypothetical protein
METYSPHGKLCKCIQLSDLETSVMTKVIGFNGFYFKSITSASKINYIWHNKQTNTVEIWGDDMFVLRNAEFRLRQRLDQFTQEKIKKEKESVYNEKVDASSLTPTQIANLIGKGGCNIKRIVKLTNADSILIDKTTNAFTVKASSEEIGINASLYLKNEIEKLK